MLNKFLVQTRLTHIGKRSGHESGDFPETFSKKKRYLLSDIVTSLQGIIERSNVAKI